MAVLSEEEKLKRRKEVLLKFGDLINIQKKLEEYADKNDWVLNDDDIIRITEFIYEYYSEKG